MQIHENLSSKDTQEGKLLFVMLVSGRFNKRFFYVERKAEFDDLFWLNSSGKNKMHFCYFGGSLNLPNWPSRNLLNSVRNHQFPLRRPCRNLRGSERKVLSDTGSLNFFMFIGKTSSLCRSCSSSADPLKSRFSYVEAIITYLLSH